MQATSNTCKGEVLIISWLFTAQTLQTIRVFIQEKVIATASPSEKMMSILWERGGGAYTVLCTVASRWATHFIATVRRALDLLIELQRCEFDLDQQQWPRSYSGHWMSMGANFHAECFITSATLLTSTHSDNHWTRMMESPRTLNCELVPAPALKHAALWTVKTQRIRLETWTILWLPGLEVENIHG